MQIRNHLTAVCIACVLILIVATFEVSAAVMLSVDETALVVGGCFQGETCSGVTQCVSGCIRITGEEPPRYRKVVPIDYNVCKKSGNQSDTCTNDIPDTKCGRWKVYSEANCTSPEGDIGYVYAYSCGS